VEEKESNIDQLLSKYTGQDSNNVFSTSPEQSDKRWSQSMFKLLTCPLAHTPQTPHYHRLALYTLDPGHACPKCGVCSDP
jgi:hypothetical protein